MDRGLEWGVKQYSGSGRPPLDRNVFPWSVVCGPWSVVCGPWSVVCGPWSVVCGPWSVVCGLFSKNVITRWYTVSEEATLRWRVSL